MSAQGLWLSAKQVNPRSSGADKKATPLCCFVHHSMCLLAFDILPAPLAQQGPSSLGQFWSTAVWSGPAAVPGLAAQSQAHLPRKGHVRSRAVRVSLLGTMEMRSVAPQLPNQGPGDHMQNQQIQEGELCGSLPHTFIKVQLLWSQQERGTNGTSVWGLQPHPQKAEEHISI